MARKAKIRLPIFLITLLIGISLVAIALLQPEVIFADTTRPLDISGLSLIAVPIDPTGGQILGTVKFGAPNVVPFERSGTIHSAEIGTGCERPKIPNVYSGEWEVPFGRIGSGDRNAEISWHGWNGIDCAYGYAEWDLTDLPNDFVATGIRLQLNLKEVQGGGTIFNNPTNCDIVYLGNNVDQIGVQNIPNRITWGSNTGGLQSAKLGTTYVPVTPSTGDFLAWGGNAYIPSLSVNSLADWCKTAGVKTFVFGQVISNSQFNQQKGVQTFNLALPLDSKFTLGFSGGYGTGKFVIDQLWWEQNGSLLVTGSSQPIKCGIGFTQVDFRCIPIVCETGFKVDVNTNQCTQIICPVGEELIGNICTPIICNVGEELVNNTCQQIDCPSGTHLTGSTCDPLICGEGFEINGNECTLKTCGIGQELIGDNCQAIQCPINTVLNGNDCLERACPTNQISIDNICRDQPNVNATGQIVEVGGEPLQIECGIGFSQVGDGCLPVELDCPVGTEPHQNICVQRLPSLLQIQTGLDPTIFLIIGLVITGMSGIGIITKRRL